jgi:hypothetical protein
VLADARRAPHGLCHQSAAFARNPEIFRSSAQVVKKDLLFRPASEVEKFAFLSLLAMNGPREVDVEGAESQ